MHSSLPQQGIPEPLGLNRFSILAPFLDQLPELWFLSLAHRGCFTSWPEPPTNHAIEGQQLGAWAHSQLGLVSLVANGKTQGLWAEAT